MTSYLTPRERSCGFYGYPLAVLYFEIVVWVYKDYMCIVTACGCTGSPAAGCVFEQCDQSVISVSQGALLKSSLFRQDTTNTRQRKSAIKSQREIKAKHTLF